MVASPALVAAFAFRARAGRPISLAAVDAVDDAINTFSHMQWTIIVCIEYSRYFRKLHHLMPKSLKLTSLDANGIIESEIDDTVATSPHQINYY
jgi:hypothetical protein